MRRTLLLLVFASCAIVDVSVSPLALAQPAPTRDDLTGTWQAVATEQEGVRSPGLVASTLEIDVRAGTYYRRTVGILVGGVESRGSLKVVGGKDGVFQVDLEFTRTGNVGESNREASSQHS